MPAASSANAERQLAAFIRKFSPGDQRLIRAVRKALRARFPTANELVYDNYNFFVIGYSPTERPSDAIVSMARAREWRGVVLHPRREAGRIPTSCFSGPAIKPGFIRIDSTRVFERPEVMALVEAAIDQARAPLPVATRGKLIIRSVSSKQRPRKTPLRRSRAKRTERKKR